MTAGKFGRRPPHDRATHPRLALAAGIYAYPPPPAVIDWITEVDAWPMYLNDEIGCCTVSAAGHMIEASTTYGQHTTVKIRDADVLEAYQAVSGYIPGRSSTDGGAVMQDVLDYWRHTGIGGHKILAFAEVNTGSGAEVAAAMALFGHIYVGVNLPRSALDQFNTGQPWTPKTPDGGTAGGHAVDWGYAAVSQPHEVITWGRVQQVSPAWMARYAEEMWVVIDQAWIDTNGHSPAGLDLAALGAAYTELTGQPSPWPVTPPPPPAPARDTDAADTALVGELGPWLAARHTGCNAAAVRAVKAWIAARGLG